MTPKSTTKTNKINPASLGLTSLQLQAFRVIEQRQSAGELTTRSDIQTALEGREKSWVSRNLAVLIEKGLIELYNQRYYKLKGN